MSALEALMPTHAALAAEPGDNEPAGVDLRNLPHGLGDWVTWMVDHIQEENFGHARAMCDELRLRLVTLENRKSTTQPITYHEPGNKR